MNREEKSQAYIDSLTPQEQNTVLIGNVAFFLSLFLVGALAQVILQHAFKWWPR